MILDLPKRPTKIFDCDDVILVSDSLKIAAFRVIQQPYDDTAAQAFVECRIANGDGSRYAKFVHFSKYIAREYAGTGYRERSAAAKWGEGWKGIIDDRSQVA